MTVTTNAEVSTSTGRRTGWSGNSTVAYGGAQVRAHYRHLAMVVAVRGRIDGSNVDQISDHIRHFVLAKEPLVLDLSGVDSFAAPGIWLLCVVDGVFRAADVEWTFVASPAVDEVLRDFDEDAKFPVSDSVHQALHNLAAAIDGRRQLLLPLIKKSA